MSDFKLVRVLIAVAVATAIAGCGRSDPEKFVASAEAYLAKAEYKAAIIELKNALNESPNNARTRFLLGKAYLNSGDPVAAATELRKAISLAYSPDEAYPLLARAMVHQSTPKKDFLDLANAPVQSAHAKAELAAMLAVAFLGMGERAEAQAQIGAALALEPANVSVRVVQAQIAAVDKGFAEALVLVDAVLAVAPDNVDALMLKGDAEAALGRRAGAVRAFARVVELRPDMVRARYSLASNYIQLKQLDNAAEQVEAMKKQAPGDPLTLHASAFVAFARQDYAGALDAIQKAVQVAPEYLPARYLSGLIDLQRGAYAAAEHSLRIVVAQAPNDDGARIALAETYLRRDQAVSARETLEPALRRAPDNIVALRLAAEIQMKLKHPELSATYLKRVNALEKGDVGSRVRLAEVSLATGDTSKGVKELEALSASDPDRREPDMALINAYVRSRDFEKALAAADALIKKQPSNPAGYNAKGAVFVAMGDLPNARLAFEKALSIDPEFAVSQYSLGRINAAERDFAGARKRYEQLLAKNPKSDYALLGLAEILIAENAPTADVVAAIQRAINANPDSVVARLVIINYHARQQNWKAALAAAQAAQTAIPDTPQILETLAAILQASGDLNQAIETYNRLARFQPDNPLPYMRIAGIQAGLKNYDAAIIALKSALAIAPNNSTIWVAMAATYVEGNKADVGLAEARRLQKEFPTRASGFALEAELFAAQKKYAEAVTAFRVALLRQPLSFSIVRLHTVLVAMGKADEAATVAQGWLKDNPKDIQVRAYLGQQSMLKGDHKAAIPMFRAAVDLDPANVVLLNNLAWSMSETGDPKAREYAERAYRLAPEAPEVVNTYGWILVQGGDSTQGIALLRKAVDLAPADAGKRLRLGMALLKVGDKPGARKELELVAKSDSAPAKAQAELLLKSL